MSITILSSQYLEILSSLHSNTHGLGRFSLGPLILVSPQSSFSSFWSSASHRSACLCRASLQFHRKFPLKTTTKKQFISTKIKNSMQTVEVKSTSSHNCLSQNDDATLNSWSQVCQWSYIWLISGTGTLYKNMLVSIGYQNFYFDFVIQTIDRRRIHDCMWENHQTLRANGSTTFFLRFMKHFIILKLYQIIKS